MPISLARVTFAALTSYAFSYNFGATLGGIPLRYRLYSSWGIPLTKIVQLLVILALTFWFGVFFISGVLFVFAPAENSARRMLQICDLDGRRQHPRECVDWFRYLFADSRPFGMSAADVGSRLRRRPASCTAAAEDLSLDAARAAVATDALPDRHRLGRHARGRLRAVRHSSRPIHGGYLTVLEVYLVAYVIVVLSHVPGGWGVLEAGMITLLANLATRGDPEVNCRRWSPASSSSA